MTTITEALILYLYDIILPVHFTFNTTIMYSSLNTFILSKSTLLTLQKTLAERRKTPRKFPRSINATPWLPHSTEFDRRLPSKLQNEFRYLSNSISSVATPIIMSVPYTGVVIFTSQK